MEVSILSPATAAEKGSDTVVVTCLVDNLQVKGLISKSPKNATVSVMFAERLVFGDLGFILAGQREWQLIRKESIDGYS